MVFSLFLTTLLIAYWQRYVTKEKPKYNAVEDVVSSDLTTETKGKSSQEADILPENKEK